MGFVISMFLCVRRREVERTCMKGLGNGLLVESTTGELEAKEGWFGFQRFVCLIEGFSFLSHAVT